ncbi:MAG: DNA helicase RecQ [Saprospiraceae bacterium]
MTLDQARTALKKYFGYDTFRPMQEDIIEAIFQKKNALVLMPTGGGKSICYQIPGVTLPGTAIVLSPLIALMKDQVEALRSNGISAAFINSSMTAAESREVEDAAVDGRIKILYVSPEKLVSQGFQPLLKRLQISLLAVDEAHCISAWGHDFRPEYTQLKFLREQYPDVPLIALTATADKLTRKDIITQLQLDQVEEFVSSFDRPNISIQVRPGQKKLEQIVDFLKKHPEQSGIIYCLARKTCVDLATKLSAKGIKAAPYHADMPSKIRSAVQEDFINDRTPVVCATIAFGMGIDKSNVRFVIHYNLPRNLEGYYQEIGRAGRDGLPAEALLFFSYGDVQIYRNMFEDGGSDAEQTELKIAKLNRMYEFAEAPVCRRKTVLNYFGEPFEGNCGNCDVCKNPPVQFDGTVAAQKALSAILRTNEKVGMNTLVDILRGSHRREILELGYDRIKTYGAGREYSFQDWMFFISQMLHLGLIEIAYDQHSQLRVTPAGRSILFDGKKVALARPKLPEEKKKTQVKAPTPAPASKQLQQDFFEHLRKVRRQIAQQEGVPPYIVFSDATMDALASKRPYTDADLLQISGIGQRKLQRYGDAILQALREFTMQKLSEGEKVSGSTYLQTLEMYKSGQSIEQIAEERGLSPLTVTNHLAVMYEKGEPLNLSEWISNEETDLIKGALPLFSSPFQLKEIFDHFNEKMSYDKIRWAVADWHREELLDKIRG